MSRRSRRRALRLSADSAAAEADPGGWRAAFARPDGVPYPAANPATAAKVALGASLFSDPRLSGDGQTSCATCHQPELSFSDGTALRLGHDREPLPRRTPSPWNLALGG